MSMKLEVLKWEDQSGGRTIVHRVPQAGMADIKLGARCIVQDSQAAVFYRTVLPVPQWIDLNQKSGLVDVHTAGIGLEAGEKRQATVEFYSSYNKNADLDPFEGSTFDRPFPVTFYIEGESSPSE